MRNLSAQSAVVVILAVLSCALFLASPPAQGTPFTVMSEDFDDVTAPALPGGWENVGYDGGNWTTAESSAYPIGVAPISLPNMLQFNSHGASTENSGFFRMTGALDLSHNYNVRVRFWMYHDNAAADKDDVVRLAASNTGWSTYSPLTTFHRYSDTPGWQLHEWTVGASVADHHSNCYLGFVATGAGGNDIFIDGLTIIADRDPGVYPEEGTAGTQVDIVGSGFGAKKGKVLLSGQATPLKVLTWSDTNISCVFGAVYPVDVYDVSVQPSDPKGAAPVVFDSGFKVQAPAIDSIDQPGGAPGTLITVNGRFFTTKRGKMLLVGSGPGGIIARSCKVASWTMNTANGGSVTTFVIPKVPSGVYDLTMQIKGMPDTTQADAITVP